MNNEQRFSEYVDKEMKEYERTLEMKNDVVLTILRVHLIIEQLLDRLIVLKLKRGDRVLDKGNLAFYQKLQLVDSFALVSDGTIQAIKQLNKLRNRCSHTKDIIITTNDIEIIGRSLGEEFVKVKQILNDPIELFFRGVSVLIHKELFGHVALLEFQDVLDEKGGFIEQ